MVREAFVIYLLFLSIIHHALCQSLQVENKKKKEEKKKKVELLEKEISRFETCQLDKNKP
jgi:hypothetical protein